MYIVYWLDNDTRGLTCLVCHMPWIQSFRNSEFSPSDWFFAFKLDLKRVLALEDPRRSTNFHTDSLEFEYPYWTPRLYYIPTDYNWRMRTPIM